MHPVTRKIKVSFYQIIMAKYIFVTGGVTSSLGKGIIAASLAKLLQSRGLSVTIQKLDPYINVDPGTLNPYEHGECYVTEDGAETDLDLGHYERFLNKFTSQANNVTTGKIYLNVIEKERAGAYLGKTVQVIPHITDEIKRHVYRHEEIGTYDLIITEIGGTVGDIESLPYLEALRQLRREVGKENCIVIHLTLIPYLSAAKELKTKPTQHSVKELLQAGIQPDILVCRTEHALPKELREKLALFCNVDEKSVIESIDADTIYDVPLLMLKEKLDKIVLKKLNIKNNNSADLESWKSFLGKLKNPTHEVNIGLVGKYNELQDAYKSIYESFIHAGAINECKVNVYPIHTATIEQEGIGNKFDNLDGILVAPGFGSRGFEGKLKAIEHVRINKIPFLGICFGMQSAVVEFCQNGLGLADANSTEVNPETPYPVIDLLPDQRRIKTKGGTMRLGGYKCKLVKGSLAHKIYGKTEISERHRHRYEFNNEYLEKIEAAGLIVSGRNPETDLVEVVELKDHPFFLAVQYHPELKSTVENPHPLFVHFVKAALQYKQK